MRIKKTKNGYFLKMPIIKTKKDKEFLKMISKIKANDNFKFKILYYCQNYNDYDIIKILKTPRSLDYLLNWIQEDFRHYDFINLNKKYDFIVDMFADAHQRAVKSILTIYNTQKQNKN